MDYEDNEYGENPVDDMMVDSDVLTDFGIGQSAPIILTIKNDD